MIMNQQTASGNWISNGYGLLRDLSVESACKEERDQVISVINVVTAEKIYLQTGSYQPTLAWEQLLEGGINYRAGFALFVVKCKREIIGFGRLNPDESLGRSVGNIGIVLLEPFRSKGIGNKLLGFLIMSAPDFGFSSLTANILVCNFRSRRLFARHGFVICNEQDIFLEHLQQYKKELLYTLDLPRRK